MSGNFSKFSETWKTCWIFCCIDVSLDNILTCLSKPFNIIAAQRKRETISFRRATIAHLWHYLLKIHQCCTDNSSIARSDGKCYSFFHRNKLEHFFSVAPLQPRFRICAKQTHQVLRFASNSDARSRVNTGWVGMASAAGSPQNTKASNTQTHPHSMRMLVCQFDGKKEAETSYAPSLDASLLGRAS